MLLNQYLGYGTSKLGIHWTPVTGHAHSDLTWFIDRAQAMGIKWVTLLDDAGGSTLQPSEFYNGKNIVQMFLERDINPVTRLYGSPLAKCDSRRIDTVRRLVAAGVRWVFGPNEPECGGEWRDTPWNGHVPSDYVELCTRNFVDWAYKLIPLGAYPGYFATTIFRFQADIYDPDSPLINPFLEFMSQEERQRIFVDGPGWIPIHNYSKNHPENFPYDAVNQAGLNMTEEEYDAKIAEVSAEYRETTGHIWVFDDYQDSVHHINFVRDRNINEGMELWDDGGDVCFWMYRGMNALLAEAGLLDYVPLISTEGPFPSVGERDDGRYAKVTPNEQIRMFEAILAEIAGVPNYFATGDWLAGCQRLDAATADGFEDQGVWTDRHNAPFDLSGELPLVQCLIDRNAGGEKVMASKLGFHIQQYRNDVEEALIRAQPPYVKVMGAALSVGTIERIKELVPDVRIIGRQHVEYQDVHDQANVALVDSIEATGCGPLCWAWESYNEIPYSHMPADQVAAFDDFMVLFHSLVRERFGVKHTVVINSPVGNLGWPGEVMPTQFSQALALPGTIVGFHCYERWKDPTARDAYLFRWVELRRQIEAMFPGKQYILSETGVTRATIPGEPDVGWRSGDGYSRYDYLDILRAQDIRMQEFDDMLAALVFQTGAKEDWTTFESAEEVADLRQNFIPVSPNEPPPVEPPPDPPPPPTPPGVINDAVSYGVTIEQADVPEGTLFWEVGVVHHLTPNENRGSHHVFVNLFDQEGRDLGAEPNEISDRPQVLIEWPTATAVIPLEKPWPDEPMGNAPIWKGQVISLEVMSELDSDRVLGIHTAHPDEPVEGEPLWNSLYHHSFLIVWRLAIKGVTTEPPPVIVEPEETLERFMRRKGWDAAGIDYNPDAALFKYAQAQGLGRPVTNEYDVTYDGINYRCQDYAQGIVFVPIGDWGSVSHVGWLKE